VSPAVDAPPTDAAARFAAAMDDDFNTPIAVAELQSLARELNSAKAAGQVELAAARAAELVALGRRLGVLQLDPETFLRKRAAKQAAPATQVEGAAAAALAGTDARAAAGVVAALSDADIERLIEERAAARKARNFKESDRIRDQLAASGVLLEDQPGGRTLWRRG